MSQAWTKEPHCDGWFWHWPPGEECPFVLYVKGGMVQYLGPVTLDARRVGGLWRRIPEPRKPPEMKETP